MERLYLTVKDCDYISFTQFAQGFYTYFVIVMIKYPEQKWLLKRKVCFSLGFKKESPWWWGSHSGWLWDQEAGSWPLEGKHKADRDRGQRQQEVGEAINPSPVSPMWTYFSNMWDYGSYLRCDWNQIIKRYSKK